MKLTRFENLESAIRLLGGSKAIAALAKEISSGKMDVSPENIVTGDSGIYYLSDNGTLTRVLISLVDKSMSYRFKPEYQEMVKNKDFENEELLAELHKYHLVKCRTVERAEKLGWRERYKMGSRRDGRFFYRFINEKEVFSQRADQLLYPCKNCLNQLASLDILSEVPDRTVFTPGDFFEFADCDMDVGIKERGQYAEQSVPNKYSVDWSIISENYKKKIEYRCEGAGCTNRDLNSTFLKRYLHAHHIDMDKANNEYSNIKALCIVCHSQQPGHSHIKQLPDYRKYCAHIASSN